MADDILSPVDLGFAEFVAKLISDVFDATVSSQAQQLEKLIELESLLAQSNDEFIDTLLAKDEFLNDVELLLSGYFPLDNGEHPHAIYEGAPYEPGKNDVPESPPIADTLGIKLAEGDYKPRAKVLTLQGVSKVYRKAAEPFAIQRRAILKQLVENGLPKLLVDSGKINAKLTFTANQVGEGSPEENGATEPASNAGESGRSATANLSPRERNSLLSSNTRIVSDSVTLNTATFNARLATPIQPINRYVGLIKPNLNDQVRLTVKPASNQSPQDTQVTTNIFSEVEIHFKTIV